MSSLRNMYTLAHFRGLGTSVLGTPKTWIFFEDVTGFLIYSQINGKKNIGLLKAVYVVFTSSMTIAFTVMWPGTIMWDEVRKQLT